MPMNPNICTIHLELHFGNTPTFEIKADESAGATGYQCKYTGSGTGPADYQWLKELLGKIDSGYGGGHAVSLCIKGAWINPDSQCP